MTGPIRRAEAAFAELDGGARRQRRARDRGGGARFEAHSEIDALVRGWRALASACDAQVEPDWRAGQCVLEGSLGLFRRAMDNLLSNCLEHGGRRIVIAGRRRPGSLVLRISDGGPGPGVALRRARRRLAGRVALGGGLAIANRAVESLGGTIRDGRPPHHRCIVVELPLSHGAPPDRARPMGELRRQAVARRNGSVRLAPSGGDRAA